MKSYELQPLVKPPLQSLCSTPTAVRKTKEDYIARLTMLKFELARLQYKKRNRKVVIMKRKNIFGECLGFG
jgi:hypothetical protein